MKKYLSINYGLGLSSFWCEFKRFYFRLLDLIVVSALFSVPLQGQTLTLSQSVSDPTPDTEVPFEYIISVSCNSTTSNCNNTVVSGYLPEEVDFINFSDPLPIGVATATYDVVTRYYELTFDDGPGNSLAQGSTIQFSIQATFPSGTVETSVASNTVSATSSNATNATSTASATVDNNNWVVPPANFPNEKIGDTEQLPNGEQYWQIRIGNISFQTIDNYIITDQIPALTTLSQIRTPEIININHPASLFYERSDNLGVWNLWTNFNLSTRQTLNVSGLGLPIGVDVSQVRADFGTMTGSALFNTYRYGDGFTTGLVLYATVDTGLADGVTYQNCADYTGTIGGIAETDSDCITTTINSGIAVNEISGYFEYYDQSENFINNANIGDTIKARWSYYSEPEMTNDVLGGVMSVILPPGMTYVPGSLDEDWTCNAFDGELPVIELDLTIDGRQIVRFVYDASFGNEFNLESTGYWDGCAYFFDIAIGPSTLEGNNVGYYYYNATGSIHDNCNTVDTDNYLNGYAPDYCEDPEDIQIVRPPGSAGIRAEKEVLGTLDALYTQFPSTGTTVPGGLSNYRITLTNPNATPIDNIEIIDILPYINDVTILDESISRFSDWTPNLAAPITVPAGVTVFYSTVANPCRDELAGANPTPFPTGCNAPNWSAVAPADITDVTALKFDLFGITLNQNDNITLEFEMRAPVNAPTGGEVSWNSFAYIAENATTNNPLLPTEAIKVGIETIPGTVPIGGDFIWDDLNGNGLQDSGEPGIDGVRIALIADTNSNGSLDVSDVEYTWTISANGGQYIFSDFPFGNYFIQFSNFPSGYVETHQDIGSNEGLDSDGATTDLIIFGPTTDRSDIDFGLYNGVLPPLWSCTTGLLTNSEFESNFTDWIDFGNTSITSDAYINSNAMLISGGQGGRAQVLNVTPGQTYRMSFYAKNTGPEAATGGFNVKDVNNNTIYSLARGVYENVYEYHSMTMTVPENGDRIEVFGWKNAGAGAAYFDAFCLELINDVCGWGSGLCTTYDPNANLLSNPGLEDTGALAFSTIFEGSPAAPLADGSTDLPGWSMDFANCAPCPLGYLIDDTANNVNNTEGDYFIWVPIETNCLRNIISVEEGVCYEFTIDAASWSSPGPQEATSFNIEIFGGGISGSGGTLLNIFEVLVPSSPSWNNLNWQTYTVTWQAPISTNTEVYFSQASSNSQQRGLALDNFQMTPKCCNPTEICDNGDDDDGDGLVDCLDTEDCGLYISCNDNDNDGICNNFDIDDDNDGIRDVDESMCNGNWQEMVTWDHNIPANTGTPTIIYPTGISAAAMEAYGSGITATLTTTYVLMDGVDQADLVGAISNNDYLEYSFTTQNNIPAMYLHQFRMTKHGLISNGLEGNYGYDFSILVSDDGFSSSSIISDIFTVDTNVDPGFTTLFQEADDNFYYLKPNTTYTFRCYFYNKTSDASVRALYDDFTIEAEICEHAWDTDGDGYVNSEDLDSDNDGLTDLTESGHTSPDANNDGIIDGADIGSGINGLFDDLESTADLGDIVYTIADSETSGDGIYDPYELDSDGDGCFDAIEESISDPDNDGLVGTGTPSVLSTGLVNGHTYGPPPNNLWQDASLIKCLDVTGVVFEDINYGGGNGRNYTTANASAVASGWGSGVIHVDNVRIELYDNTGSFVAATITNASGQYTFSDIGSGNYSVRVVNQTVSSNRGSNATGQTIIPSQTYRYTGAIAVVNEVGGFNPSLVDAGSNTTNSNISTLYTGSTTVHSRSDITIISTNVTGVDFGFNFDVIVNENNGGQGSLRQFILNSNELSNTNLDQEDFPPTGENFPKPSGTEHSIFMIGGLGVHRITPISTLPTISDEFTHITGYTQEGSSQGTIAGRTNTIELHGNTVLFDGFTVNANNTTISGLVINEFRTGINGNATRNNLFIWGNYVGTSTNGLTGLGNSSAGINLQNFTSSFIGTNADNSNDANEGNLVSDNSQGIQIRNGSNFLIAGNIVGLNSTGNADIGNTFNGIYIRDATGTNVIGYDDNATSSTAAHFRNISSGNGNDGVRLFNASNQIIAGNYLGTDVTGTIGRANGNYGVQFSGDDYDNIIGTDSDGVDDTSERNVISGNGSGIRLASSGNGTGNRISGNYIGTDVTGNAPLGNLNNGIEINDLFINTIIGTNGDNLRDAIERNIISGNIEDGIRLDGTTGNIVSGNFIGLGVDGSTNVGNGKRGILIATTASENTIGFSPSFANSDELVVGNRIIYNDDAGIGVSGTGTQNRISRNQLSENSDLGIDLGYDGVTSNDNGDGDTGANNLYNFPIISSVMLLNDNLTIRGFAPSGSEIEFFIADAGPNPSPLPASYTRSFGEGREYLFTVTEGSAQDNNSIVGNYSNDGTGIIFTRTQNRFTFTIDVSAMGLTEGMFLSATAIDSNNNTSEFSNITEVLLNCGTAILNPHVRYYRSR